jgi:glycosyltransferase involved in cell wall biosynthesis
MKILQVSTSDLAGGAERSAKNLAAAYGARGHESWLAVGHKRGDDPNVFVLPNDESRNIVARTIDKLRREHEPSIGRVRGLGRLGTLARTLAEPRRALAAEFGREDFDFPGTRRLLELPPSRPDIVHIHNLHGGYFDLRALPALSRQVPTILNVRDGWLMSGHCAFGLGCERWKTGCGSCPDLSLHPAIKRDATAFNWELKRAVLAASRLYIATPSQWMMDRVQESIIAASGLECRVIPNGVDTEMFKPGDRQAARAALGLAGDTRVLLVAANGLRHNVWKDYATLRGALERLGARAWPWPVVVLAVGETAAPERIGSVELRFVPFVGDSAALAGYYRAADIYLHAARVESFGNVLLEARACGTAIVATATGGIPEQVAAGTGLLVEQGDPAAFAQAVETLLGDDALRATIAAEGLRHVRRSFTLGLQAARFLAWYEELVHA